MMPRTRRNLRLPALRPAVVAIVLPALLAGCATVQAPSSAAPPASDIGVVSAADPRAAAAGVEMLRRGGNATDAAIATMFALNVVEPQNSGLGGGSFMIRHDGRTGRLSTLDGRETAPAAATPGWFLGADGKPLPKAGVGGRSVGVPGNLAMIALAHRQSGHLPWKVLFEPAIRMASEGIVVSPRLHNGLNLYGRHVTGDARALYFAPDGGAMPKGTTLRQTALADTLRMIARRGPRDFYQGAMAGRIVAAVNGAELNPAPLTRADLAHYTVKAGEPLCSAYRAYRICGMGPPSSGGITVAQILRQIERFDIGAMGRGSPQAWNLFADSMRLAYADRDAYIADPAFISVPAAGMLAPEYIAGRSALLSPDKALAVVEPGQPAGAPARQRAPYKDDPGTSALAVVDGAGNAVQVTTTVNGYFGSGIGVDGVMLNNELPDFDVVPEKDGFLVANRVEGGKRPRSSMSPTILYGPDGKVRMVIGAAGGATIIAQVAKAIMGVVDWNMSAQDAIAMGLIFAPTQMGTIEKDTELEALLPTLTAMGQSLRIAPLGLKANAIERVGAHWIGAADPRSEGVAMDTAGTVSVIPRRVNDLNGAHE